MKYEPVFIAGPSGIGKSHLVRYLVEHFNYEKIVTLTTRPPRSEDIPGITYEFVTRHEFEQMETSGFLAVADDVFDHKYGLRKGTVEKILLSQKIPICEVYSPHIQLFIDAFPNALSVFLKPKSLELLEKRMRSRGDTEDNIKYRLTAVKNEIATFCGFSHRYFSAVLDVSEDNFQQLVFSITKLNEGV